MYMCTQDMQCAEGENCAVVQECEEEGGDDCEMVGMCVG